MSSDGSKEHPHHDGVSVTGANVRILSHLADVSPSGKKKEDLISGIAKISQLRKLSPAGAV